MANSSSVTIDQNIGQVSPTGNQQVSPAGTTAYTLTATGTGGSAERVVLLNVLPMMPSINSFQASPTTANFNSPVTLLWNTSNATQTVIDQGVGVVSPTNAGTIQITPQNPGQTTTYTLTARGSGAETRSSTSVTVSDKVIVYADLGFTGPSEGASTSKPFRFGIAGRSPLSRYLHPKQ